MCIFLVTSWSENYGDANAPVSQSFIDGWKVVKSGKDDWRIRGIEVFVLDRKIFLLGIVQALFEGSMYIFVLEWTPALTEALNQVNLDKKDNTKPPIPHGLNRLVVHLHQYRYF